jgi:hypothetical protein
MIVFDVNSAASFGSADAIYSTVIEASDPRSPVHPQAFLLIGNKTDQENQRQVRLPGWRRRMSLTHLFTCRCRPPRHLIGVLRTVQLRTWKRRPETMKAQTPPLVAPLV